MSSPLEQFDVVNLININFLGFNFSISSILLPLIILNLFLIYLINILKINLKLIPELWQLTLEIIYRFVFSIIKQQIGPQGFVYFPFIFLMFIFVLICNFISLIPFGIAMTSHLIIILWISITSCLYIFLLVLVFHKLKFLHIFIPESPLILLPVLIPIEIFSYMIRMFSLAIRLSANILAGHTLVFIICSFLLSLVLTNKLLAFLFLIPLFAVFFLEFGIAVLQAYVFTVLLCIYLSDSLKTPGH